MKTPLQHRAVVGFAIMFLAVATSAFAPAASHAQGALPPPVAFPPQAQPPAALPRLPPRFVPPPPGPVQPPAISGASFACMADAGDPTGRDLAGAMINDYQGMTNQACRSSCAQQGFAFAATQYGGSCFCGNTFGRYGPAASASPMRSCNLACAGNPNEICGGEWANSVSLTGVTPPSPADGGQCLVKAQGNYMGSGGAAGSYNSVELHRWEKVSTTGSTATTKAYQFRYTMTSSGYMDQTGAGGQWRGTWGGTAARMEAWQGVLATNPATGQSAWRLRTSQGFSTVVPFTGNLLNPLRPDPRSTADVRAFALPVDLWSPSASPNESWVLPVTTGTTTQAVGVKWLWNNPLSDATYTCSWNVTM